MERGGDTDTNMLLLRMIFFSINSHIYGTTALFHIVLLYRSKFWEGVAEYLPRESVSCVSEMEKEVVEILL